MDHQGTLALFADFCYNFLMLSLISTRTQNILSRGILAVGILAITTVGILLALKYTTISAFLLAPKPQPPWFVLSEQQVDSGATIPAGTNVIFHLPFDFTTIDREVLFGQKGKTTRYWGYCFPQNYDPNVVSTRVGFPGQMFLSEKEQADRAAAALKNQPQFSLQNPPTTQPQVAHQQDRIVSTIRNQINVFKPGMLCYIMTESSLAIGLDPDGDGLNDKLEAELNTDPQNPDTDGDGIKDGVEFMTGTSPTLRDTDGDGIIDGIEDKNQNGRVDPGETDPRTADTDRDGLCDGMCRMRLSNGQQLYSGEDRNLNGIVDNGETDPLKVDSESGLSGDDGYNDYQRFLKCILDGQSTSC
jgi:hypothetical protein